MKLQKTKEPKKKKAKKATPLEIYQKHIEALEKKKKRNEKLKEAIDFCLKQHELHIVPVLKLKLKETYSLTEILVKHFGKKSLAGWERDELSYWIRENLDEMASNNNILEGDLEALAERYNDMAYALAGVPRGKDLEENDFEGDNDFFEKGNDFEKAIMKMQLKQMFINEIGIDITSILSEEELEECLSNPGSFLKNNAKKIEKLIEEELGKKQKEHFEEEREKLQESKSILGNTSVNKMYKKIAKILHPDTELEAEEKERKHHLMSTLVSAKKENDILTIMEMYNTYVSEDEVVFEEKELKIINEVLKDKLDTLEEEFYDIKFHHPKRQVFEELLGKSEKSILKNVEKYIDEITTEEEKNRYFQENLKTLKTLKVELRSRDDEKDSFSMFDVFSNF